MAKITGQACDLFLGRGIVPHKDIANHVYGTTPPVATPKWLVCCPKPDGVNVGALPLGFETIEDAERAMTALIEAGLGTVDALHQRLKIDMDWDGVRRIMLEALAW